MCPSYWGLAALWRDRACVHPIGGRLLCGETEHVPILLGAGCYRQVAVLGSDLKRQVLGLHKAQTPASHLRHAVSMNAKDIIISKQITDKEEVCIHISADG